MDIEIKRWAFGKEGNLRALLSTLQYVSRVPQIYIHFMAEQNYEASVLKAISNVIKPG